MRTVHYQGFNEVMDDLHFNFLVTSHRILPKAMDGFVRFIYKEKNMN